MSQITNTGSGGGGGGSVTSFETDDTNIVTPIAGLVVVHGNGGITTSGATNVITITGSAVFPWVNVTATTVNFAANTGYIMNNPGSGVVGTLPAVAPQGTIVRVAGIISGDQWEIHANAGQLIYDAVFNSGPTLIAATSAATMELLCITANTTWLILSGSGSYKLQ